MKAYRELERLDPNFRKKVVGFMKEAEKWGVFITETWRSTARQKYLYDKKLSFLDGKRYISMHQKGLAMDIAFRGKELYPKNHLVWVAVARIAKEHGLDWGYDLWKWDKPHFQDDGTRHDWRSRFGKTFRSMYAKNPKQARRFLKTINKIK